MAIDIRPDVVTVACTRTDGGLSVTRLVVNEYREPTKDEQAEGITEKVLSRHHDITPEYIDAYYAKRVAAGSIPGVVEWRIVPEDYLDEDTDHTYRNAWKHTEGRGKPDHDMPKAREIHRVYLRKARMAEFCRLDTDYRIADEAGDQAEKTRIGAERQAFRDVTEDPRIEEAQTVEDLKALRLDALLPEITKGESYMNNKMRISPAIPTVAEAVTTDLTPNKDK